MSQAHRDTLQKCSREEYAAYILALRHDQSRAVNGNSIGAMQWVNDDNLVIAQAIYQNGSAKYQIKR